MKLVLKNIHLQKDVEADVIKLGELNRKYYASYGKDSPEILQAQTNLNKMKPTIKEAELSGKLTAQADANKSLLSTQAVSYHTKKLIDATKNLELAKANPSAYSAEQMQQFRNNVDEAKSKIASVNDAVKNGDNSRLMIEANAFKKEAKLAPPVNKTQDSNSGQVANNTQGGIDWMNGKNNTKPLMLNPPSPQANAQTIDTNNPNPVVVAPKTTGVKSAALAKAAAVPAMNMATAQDYNSGVITPPENPSQQPSVSSPAVGSNDAAQQKQYEDDMAARLAETDPNNSPKKKPFDIQDLQVMFLIMDFL